MFIAKKREKSPTLLVMESLLVRLGLDRAGMRYLNQLRSGDKGELDLCGMAGDFLGDSVIGFPDLLLNPLLFSMFQWDLVLLCNRTFYLYEGKNAGGEYQYGSEVFKGKKDFTMKNPLIQMTDNKLNFEQLLRDLGFGDEFQVVAFSVMTNPEFTLFGMPDDVPILLLSQLPAHFRELDRRSKPLNGLHRKVMEALLASQGVADVFWKFVPAFSYGDLQKGVRCEACGGFEVSYSRQKYDCKGCGYRGDISELIAANIVELRRLFPEERIRTDRAQEWCGGKFHLRRIKRAINKVNQVALDK